METADLVGQIYESVGDSEALAATLVQITEFGDSRGTQLALIDKTGRWAMAKVVGFDPALLEAYVAHYAADDPRMAFTRRNPGLLVACHQAVGDQAAFERSPLVNELLNRDEARFAMASMIPIGPDHAAVLCLMRGRRDGRYGDEQIEKVAHLLPHMRRALSLHVRLGRLESRLTALDALVDRLSSPVLLVDGTGALRHANSAGLEALRQARFLVLRQGRVEPRSQRLALQFFDVLAAATGEGQADAPGTSSTTMRLLDADGRVAVLLAQSLRGQNTAGMGQTDIGLFLTYANPDPRANDLRLQAIFGLTPAETRLVAHLLHGKTIRDVSDHLHLSRETLKSQLRSLFEKTGTRRQSELIAVLLSSISIPIE